MGKTEEKWILLYLNHTSITAVYAHVLTPSKARAVHGVYAEIVETPPPPLLSTNLKIRNSHIFLNNRIRKNNVQEREQTCNKGAASGEETCSNLPAVLTAMLRTTVHTTVAAAAGETTITKKKLRITSFSSNLRNLQLPVAHPYNSFFFPLKRRGGKVYGFLF